jgi:hypothetical protein
MANTWTYDLANLKLGAGKLFVDTGGGTLAPVGITTELATINYTPKYQPITPNEIPQGDLDELLIGEEFTFSVTLIEMTDANFQLAFPMATRFTGSGVSYGFGRQAFEKISSHFVKLKYHPMNSVAGAEDDETILTDDFTVWKCAHVGTQQITFEKNKEHGYKMTFKAYWDTSKVAGMRLALKGDPANTTLDIVPPTCSATVGMYADKAGPTYTAVVKGTELADVLIASRLKFVFSEAIEPSSALNYKNYICNNKTTDVALSLAACTFAYDAATFTVTITTPTFTTLVHYDIGVCGVRDLAGNQMIPDTRRILIGAA